MNYNRAKNELEEKGYALLENCYSSHEIQKIINCIQGIDQKGSSFLKSKDVFAIRQLFKVIPQLKDLVFNQKLNTLLSKFYPSNYFLTKAIYFDKPSTSNWFVPYHQDLSVSVNQKVELDGYTNWTSKKGQFGVQPPIEILARTITLRIHFDQTDQFNGALKVIPKSHKRGVIRAASKDWDSSAEQICAIEKGGVMLMKPLTLHASNRTTNNKQRRVIHLEFCDMELSEPLEWLERVALTTNT